MINDVDIDGTWIARYGTCLDHNCLVTRRIFDSVFDQIGKYPLQQYRIKPDQRQISGQPDFYLALTERLLQ